MRSMRIFHKDMDSPGGKPFRPLHDDRVYCSGQPVAVELRSWPDAKLLA